MKKTRNAGWVEQKACEEERFSLQTHSKVPCNPCPPPASAAPRPESAGLRSAESTQRSQGPDGGERKGDRSQCFFWGCVFQYNQKRCVCVCLFSHWAFRLRISCWTRKGLFPRPPRLKSVVLLETGSPKEGFGKRTALAASNSWDRLNPPDRGCCVSLLSSVQIDENPVSQTGSQPI